MKKEDFSVAMNNIDINFIEEAENYDMRKTKKIKRPLSRLAIAAIVAGCIIFSCIAYASVSLTDWASFISFYDKDGNETKVTVSDKAFFKEIPDGVPVPEEDEPMIPMSKTEAEETLGFHILESTLASENTVYNYNAFSNKNSNTVARIDLWCPGFITENKNKTVSASIQILSTDAEEGYILPFIEGTDAMGGKTFEEKFHIENLNIDAVIYYPEDLPTLLNATFVYDNIYYHIQADNYTLDEFKAILNTFE